MLRISFHTINLLLIIFYLFPGQIFGCLFYKDCNIQPALTNDFIISSNHFFAFLFLGIISFYSFSNQLNKIIIYTFSISIFLELSHLYIPKRTFEINDLFGNIIGIIISLIIYSILKKINFGGKTQ
tara:strand:- start:329 stop:706 length:378 start_codon:yes stop_codon:yes gene_type:complete